MRSIIDEIRYILQKNFTFIILFTFAVFYPIVSTSRVGRYDGSYEKIKMLNDEGVRLSNNEQFSQAVEHLFGAHKLDPENKTIKKNLANTYVRFAIELKSAGKQDEAIALLEKASLLNANIDSLHTLLARLYYEKGDLLNAEKETRIALLGSPHDPHLLKFLAHLSFLMEKHSDALDAYHRISEIHHIPIDTFDTGKINREREVFASYQKMYAHPFIVYYPNNQYKERAGWVAQSLSQAYLRLGEWFKYYPATEISVYCYTQEDFGSVTHDNVYIIGLYDGKIRIRIDSDSEIQLKKTAAHEYAHHVLSCITRHNIPFWCNEGIAQYVANEWDSLRTKLFSQAIDKGSLLEFSALEEGTSARFDVHDVRLAYMQSYAAIDFLVAEYGERILNDIIRELKQGNTAQAAVENTVLLSYDELKREVVSFYKSNRLLNDSKLAAH